MTADPVDRFLAHYGVKGMKWGKRGSTIRTARKALAGKKAAESEAKVNYADARKSGKKTRIAETEKRLQEARQDRLKTLNTALTLTRGEQVAAVLLTGGPGIIAVAGLSVASNDKVVRTPRYKQGQLDKISERSGA